MRRLVPVLLAFLSAPFALAQGSTPACTAAWPPCGPDRVLGDEELRALVARPGETVRMQLIGATSQRGFTLLFKPDGGLDLAVTGGMNIGRDWRVEGGKLCLRGYQNVWGGKFNCGTVEIVGGQASWVEPLGAGSRNVITSVEAVKR